jgi:hypothetical protein
MWRPDLGKYTAHLQQPAPPGAKPLPHASSNVIPKQTTVGGELSGPLLRSWQADPFNRNSIYFTGGGDSMMCTLALTSAIGASWCVCVCFGRGPSSASVHTGTVCIVPTVVALSSDFCSVIAAMHAGHAHCTYAAGSPFLAWVLHWVCQHLCLKELQKQTTLAALIVATSVLSQTRD